MSLYAKLMPVLDANELINVVSGENREPVLSLVVVIGAYISN